MEDRKATIRLMQRMDPFCKHISKRLFSGKAPSNKLDTFTHIKSLIYKHVMDSNQGFLALVISKSWHFTVFTEAYDKLGHHGVNRTYHLVKCQYYWKGMNKVICKCINNCALCNKVKNKDTGISLQMTDVPNRPFDKRAIDLVSDFSVSASGNQQLLTITSHLTGWPDTFPISDKKTETIVCIFLNNYLPINMCPCFILSDNGT